MGHADENLTPTETKGGLEGQILDGRYSAETLLGHGPLMDLYRGKQVNLARAVAIKILRPDTTPKDQDLLDRLKKEIDACSRLDHSGLAHVIDSGVHEGRPYLVRDFIAGKTLEEAIRATPTFVPQNVLGVLLELAEALGGAHRAGVVHRALKPTNVVINRSDQIRIVDFAVTSLKPAAQGSGGEPVSEGHPGFAAYLAPEQLRGRLGDHRSDLYALGVMAYRMLAGRVPFGTSGPEILSPEGRSTPFPLAKIARVPQRYARLSEIVMQLLEEDREKRFLSAASLADALRNLSDELKRTDAEKHSTRPASMPPSVAAAEPPVEALSAALAAPVGVPAASDETDPPSLEPATQPDGEPNTQPMTTSRAEPLPKAAGESEAPTQFMTPLTRPPPAEVVLQPRFDVAAFWTRIQVTSRSGWDRLKSVPWAERGSLLVDRARSWWASLAPADKTSEEAAVSNPLVDKLRDRRVQIVAAVAFLFFMSVAMFAQRDTASDRASEAIVAARDRIATADPGGALDFYELALREDPASLNERDLSSLVDLFALSGDFSDRADRILQTVGARAVDPLKDAFVREDADPMLRRRAGELLRTFGVEVDFLPIWTNMLESSDCAERQAAIEALKELGDRRALPKLQELAKKAQTSPSDACGAQQAGAAAKLLAKKK